MLATGGRVGFSSGSGGGRWLPSCSTGAGAADGNGNGNQRLAPLSLKVEVLVEDRTSGGYGRAMGNKPSKETINQKRISIEKVDSLWTVGELKQEALALAGER